MKCYHPTFEESFKVLGNSSRSQAAQMTLSPGESTGGKDNMHEADQWLFAISGTGEAVVNEQRIEIVPGLLLLIEAGEAHEITCGGRDFLKTLNFYTPPTF